jgi:acid phosphatase
MDNDGHDTSLEYAANWSLAYLTPLLSNAQFMNNTLILLTYDESETYPLPNHITSILLGGAVPQSLKGTKDSTVYTLYSILSTLQNNWDLPNLGRYDVGANVFDFVAQQTGYKNIAPSDASYINNSYSYGGFLNSESDKYLPIPAPNLQLIGAGGQGVADVILKEWKSAAELLTPYDGTGKSYDGGDGITNPNAPVYHAQGAANITVADNVKEKSAARRTMKLDISWSSVGFGAFAVAAFLA